MTDNEMNLMIAELAVKCNVTQEEAKAALEAWNWNKLTAGQVLVNEKLRKAQEIEEVVSNCEATTAQATAQAVADEPTNRQNTVPEHVSLHQDDHNYFSAIWDLMNAIIQAKASFATSSTRSDATKQCGFSIPRSARGSTSSCPTEASVKAASINLRSAWYSLPNRTHRMLERRWHYCS